MVYAKRLVKCTVRVCRNEPILIILAKVHALFAFGSVSPNVLFLFQDPVQDTVLHLVVMSP